MRNTKTEKLMLQIPVRVTYDTARARREALADLKRDIGYQCATCGEDGSATVKTLRPKFVKTKD